MSLCRAAHEYILAEFGSFGRSEAKYYPISCSRSRSRRVGQPRNMCHLRASVVVLRASCSHPPYTSLGMRSRLRPTFMSTVTSLIAHPSHNVNAIILHYPSPCSYTFIVRIYFNRKTKKQPRKAVSIFQVHLPKCNIKKCALIYLVSKIQLWSPQD